MGKASSVEFDMEEEIACLRRDADCCRARACWIERQSLKREGESAPQIFRDMAARYEWIAAVWKNYKN